jgi:fructosamine-3-kinase
VPDFVKRRGQPEPGSIPAALDIFRNEVRFYREIAPVAGVRVPACHRAEAGDDGTLLVLEDLSGWQEGADPVRAARLLSQLHQRWSGLAPARWPWLRPVGAAADLVAELYDRTWPALAGRADIPPQVAEMGRRLVGQVRASEQAINGAGQITLAHGDASAANMRTSADGEIVLLDWEDVSAAPGICDLAWLLLSSVRPARWDEVIAAYGTQAGLAAVFPAITVQGLLSLSGHPAGSAEAAAWVERLNCVAGYLQLH